MTITKYFKLGNGMKLKNIKINDYKSINEVEFPIIKRNNSYTTVLLGKNETGKSNILEAMSALEYYNEEQEIDFLSVRNQQNEADIVSVFYSVEAENCNAYREAIAKKIKMPSDMLSRITVLQACKEIYIQKDENKYNSEWSFNYKPIGLNGKFYIEKTITIPAKVVNNEQQPAQTKRQIEIVTSSEIKDITDEEKSKYIELTREKFESIIEPILINYFDANEIPVSIWKADPNYLIQDSISLKDFAKKPYLYPPLRNIFSLSGFDTTEKILEKINEIEKSSNYRKKLQKQLSNETTKYMNKKWAEHKISIDVEISDELNIHVKVQDKDAPDAYHNMEERSQGFKHFVSFLLSLSINNKTGNLKNNLILIDEPEVHLHPSGVRYMLQELLEIGKNNYVFIATHSNFMIDKNTKERHFLVSKKNGITNINQVSTDENLIDDEILQAAFGLNVVRDFISNDKLLVEGASDKVLIQKALNTIDKNNCIKITNGKGDNLHAVASLAGYYEIFPIVIVDDDVEGQKIKNDILKIGTQYTQDNVFTIRDLCGDIKANGTIEDTLPIDYVLLKTNEVLLKENIESISLNENPFCEQIKLHLQQKIDETDLSKKEKKEKVDRILQEIKIKISNDFSCKQIEQKAPLLYKLAKNIAEKL